MTSCLLIFFFFNDTATTEIYTLSLHDALPIWRDEVVQVLAERGEPGERRVAEDRQQDVLAEQHPQARDAEHAEADGSRPVDDLLEGAEAAHQAAGGRLVQLHRPFPEIEGDDRREHQHHHPAADERHRPVAEIAPCLARGRHGRLAREARRRLDQHAGLAALDAGVVAVAALDLAHHRRVVARLGGLACLLLLRIVWHRSWSLRGSARSDGEAQRKQGSAHCVPYW